MIDTGWKKEMEKLCKETAKNWERTGNVKKSSGVNGNINLGYGKDIREERKL